MLDIVIKLSPHASYPLLRSCASRLTCCNLSAVCCLHRFRKLVPVYGSVTYEAEAKADDEHTKKDGACKTYHSHRGPACSLFGLLSETLPSNHRL